MRYIDADKLKEAWYTKHNITEEDCGACFVGYSEVPRLIDNEPTADVRENVRGRWLPHDLENGEKSIDEDCCSVCGERFREIAMTGCEWNFCPNCGADMRGEKDG